MFKGFWKNLQLPKAEAQPEMRGVGTPAAEQPLDDVQAARKRFEQQKMTRRQALRKMGVMSATAVIGILSIDDLARLSAERLKQHGATRALGESVAHEFKDAGVAFADTMPKPSSMAKKKKPPKSCEGHNANCEQCLADLQDKCRQKDPIGIKCQKLFEACEPACGDNSTGAKSAYECWQRGGKLLPK